jgi:hypothetical protein
MELSLQTRAFSRKWRIAIGSAAVLGIFLLIAYYSLKELQTYLIIVDPIPVSITLDGGPVKCAKFNSHCGFTVREIWGSILSSSSLTINQPLESPYFPLV